ncbi:MULTISPECIES: SEC-C metal-binding domain-containing protein [Clostridium]|uniref:SecC motif-containing protein n=2 Tax=Clostridium TaxID=1485 RepID=A0A1S9N7V0_CLOBE|nr:MULTISPECIES: SEC-C metal-binding domain-containing protein [Clostridium]MBN7574596.1 SEC-C domain-containing protein [Clostridium beijerinckii]MBN7579559.1 SEC-C domain-containing protein [Clostridium beijerinckii]MBN7584157.1 SEC-C domain-containing protein [Clostridium beijerinckii]MBO0520099.1 SEC-C domain-containing protein [Clostridium beijerinckii]MZK50151.1 SecC motif-containing protein [Clostridium beijerinckii]
MQGRCYYCNKELTERTIKRHAKSCSVMKKSIEEKMNQAKEVREQFIISMKDKYNPSLYCIYVSIDAKLQLQHLDKFIRDIWVECCGHLSAFHIDEEIYHDNSDEQYEMNFYLKDVLNINKKFEYEYDFGSTTYLTLEVVDIIQVPSEFSQVEVIARNNPEEGKFNNSPRDGVCGYIGNKDAEKEYLPGNNKKYKVSNKKPIHNNDAFSDFDYSEQMIENDFLKHHNKFTNSFIHTFFKETYSFDLEELIKPYPKKEICSLAENIGLKLSYNLNKNQVIERYIDEYENYIRNKMHVINDDMYRILLKYIKNNGIISISDNEAENYADKHAFFMNQGMVFPCLKDRKPILLMPEVMQAIVKQSDTLEFRKLMKKNSEIMNIFRGMIKLYGVLCFEDVKGLMKRYDNVEEQILLSILEEGSFYYNNEYYGTIDDDGKIIFVNVEIEDYEEILNNIDNNLDYSMISKDDLISMSNEDYLERSSIGRKFSKEFSSMFLVDKNDAAGTMNMLALDIQYRNSEEILEDIINGIDAKLDKEDEIRVFNIVNKFINNIPLWKYKGATINEKSGNNKTIESKKEVGRNDPCPCQSGKKYKKCCGRNGNVIQLF